MPGRVFILDPIVTNRVMLKSQLTAEYFTVEIAPDLPSVRQQLRSMPPDVILLNYKTEEANGFATCEDLRLDPVLKKIPLVLLCHHIKDSFWQNGYRLGVEEILPVLPDIKFLGFRLTQIMRGKEQLGRQQSRQDALINMGFVEKSLIFPPKQMPKLRIDCTHAARISTSLDKSFLHQYLQTDFSLITLSSKPVSASAVQIIDESQLGRSKALQQIRTLKRAGSQAQSAPKLLFISCENNLENYRRALDLGADDFMVTPYATAELANRLRRLAWLYHVKCQADSAIDEKLQLALRDEMTGLYNRRYALQYLENLNKSNSIAKRPVTVMMLDLDNFKAINDTHGHSIGDTVICETARRLTQNLRGGDLVARVGGEEFLVVLRDTSRAQARKIAQRMCAHINARPFQIDAPTRSIHTSISIGVAHCENDCIPPQKMIQLADDALYQSKGAGRNRVTIIPRAA